MIFALLLLMVALVAAIVTGVREVRVANTRAHRMKGYFEDESRSHQQTRNEVWDLQNRVDRLEAELKEAINIEEGEEYVRRSLGLPPEDQEESA